MGKSRNHHKWDDEEDDVYVSKKKKWYDDAETELHRHEKHRLLEDDKPEPEYYK